jgi:uncharacterized membrane protein (DUF485 family)
LLNLPLTSALTAANSWFPLTWAAENSWMFAIPYLLLIALVVDGISLMQMRKNANPSRNIILAISTGLLLVSFVISVIYMDTMKKDFDADNQASLNAWVEENYDLALLTSDQLAALTYGEATKLDDGSVIQLKGSTENGYLVFRITEKVLPQKSDLL